LKKRATRDGKLEILPNLSHSQSLDQFADEDAIRLTFMGVQHNRTISLYKFVA
jgi:hypothetical protein